MVNDDLAEEVAGAEWAEWYRLTPEQRFLESMKLWETYLALGGSLEPEPDTQSLSSIRKSGAKTLLMSGQACVFYGAAEFSREERARDREYWAPLRHELEQFRRTRRNPTPSSNPLS